MNKYVDKIVSLPKWYAYGAVLVYSVLTAEYMSEINRFFLSQGIEVTSLLKFFMQLNYVASILSSISVWVILALLFHLTALLLDGDQKFVKFLLATALVYIIPAVCMFIAIMMMDGVSITDSENTIEELGRNERFQTIQYIVNGSFVPFYILTGCIIHYLYAINWLRALLSVIIPVASIWGCTELFSLI